MSNERQETIEDIVADIRAQNQGLPEDGYALSPLAGDLLSIADRIEAAHKREQEAGSEAAKICGEIGEMVGGEAACRQPVTDCHGLNTAAMREALEVVKRLFDGLLMWQTDIRKAHEAVDAALAKPPRNCDRFGGDLKMLQTAWFDWTGSPSGQNPDGTVKLTFAEWLLEIAEVHHA